jgi:hypothetical protein
MSKPPGTDAETKLSVIESSCRHAIHGALRAYVDSVYREKKATIAVYGTDDHKITVCISAKNVRLSSFWSAIVACLSPVVVGVS